jgi:aspartate aminotransferase
MTAIRPTILSLERNGIGEVSFLGLGRKDIIPLWFGEGDIVTPPFIRDAAKRALDEGKTFYTFTRGITELRSAIAAWASRQSGREIDVDRVTVPGAAMMGAQIALQCVCEPGDNVLIISPMWPNIFQAVIGSGATPRFVRLDGGANGEPWTLNLQRLFDSADARTKAIFFASPSNPTGWIMSEREQRAILEFTRKRGIAIISDEVYTPIVYDTPAPSFGAIAEPEDDVFIINSFSKAWAMTGWRVGWLIHPRRLGTQMAELSAYNNTGATVFAQYGALEAITKGDEFIKWQVERCRTGLSIVEQAIAGNNRMVRFTPSSRLTA